jgi:hypothetical protein
VVRTFGGQAVEITADVFNLLNLLNDNWGLVRETNFFEQRSGLLNLAGYDDRGTANPSDDRARYTIPTRTVGGSTVANLPNRKQVQTTSSRWRIQLGAKYAW